MLRLPRLAALLAAAAAGSADCDASVESCAVSLLQVAARSSRRSQDGRAELEDNGAVDSSAETILQKTDEVARRIMHSADATHRASQALDDVSAAMAHFRTLDESSYTSDRRHAAAGSQIGSSTQIRLLAAEVLARTDDAARTIKDKLLAASRAQSGLEDAKEAVKSLMNLQDDVGAEATSLSKMSSAMQNHSTKLLQFMKSNMDVAQASLTAAQAEASSLEANETHAVKDAQLTGGSAGSLDAGEPMVELKARVAQLGSEIKRKAKGVQDASRALEHMGDAFLEFQTAMQAIGEAEEEK